jgi:hypothetical protein
MGGALWWWAGTVQPWAIYGKQNLADSGFGGAGANNLLPFMSGAAAGNIWQCRP